MNQLKFAVLGLMSGTSLDGLDICFAKFQQTEANWHFELLAAETIPYAESWKSALAQAHQLSQTELKNLSSKYGLFLSETVNDFIKQNSLNEIDFISSHGHTVLHQPEHKVTMQIGNGPEIFNQTGIKTICDFRVQDVLLGGQGAPLVPIGDELLFSDYAACLNLGGFANISLRQNDERIAYDICPVNIVMNALSEKLGFDFDADGAIARSGVLIPSLLEKLNALSFYSQTPPKSLGREWVEEHILPILSEFDGTENILATFCEHAATQIATILQAINGEILATGGGCFNTFLMERIQFHSNKNIYIPQPEIVNFKEALIFAFLGVLRVSGQINCLQSVTGARINHSSGRIYSVNPSNF